MRKSKCSIEFSVSINGSVFEGWYDLEQGEPVNIDIKIGNEPHALREQSREIQDKIYDALRKEIANEADES